LNFTRKELEIAESILAKENNFLNKIFGGGWFWEIPNNASFTKKLLEIAKNE
jgi:hypothetical protein